jgi:tetratricopeptide (TPR) repeat protein
MYFENNTGDENLDHWRKMIPGLVIADLTQSKYIEVLSGEKLYKILSDLGQEDAKSYSSDILKQIATRGRVNHIMFGNFAKAGDLIRINVTLQDARTEKIVGSEGVEGKGEESIFSMIDGLTRKVKTSLKLSAEEIADDIDREVGKITTSSPEAYRYYTEGRNYHHSGAARESIQAMEKAITIDPEFAMAYRSMAMTYSNLGYDSQRKKYLRMAFELVDRLSDREKYLIQGEFYRESEKTYDKALEAYGKLLEIYPTATIGNTNLGILHMNLEDWDKAIERFEFQIQNQDDSFFPYFNMQYAYAAKGLYDKAQEVLEYYLKNFSNDPMIRWSLALNYLCQGKYDLAHIELDRAMALFPFWYFVFTKGDLYLYTGDLAKAENEYQELLKETEPSAQQTAIERLAALYILQGRFDKAKGQFEQAIDHADTIGENVWKSVDYFLLAATHSKAGKPEDALSELEKAWKIAVEEELLHDQRMTLLEKTLAYIEMNMLDDAQRAAKELEDLIRKGMNQKLLRYYYLAEGKIELERKNYSRAIEEFENAISLLPFQSEAIFGENHAIFLDSLAQAYYRGGDLESALKEYEKITKLTTGRLWDGDIYAKSFYMLGKIYEEQGETAEAVEGYEKFLDLWKKADPDLPEVNDARARLAKLKSQ